MNPAGEVTPSLIRLIIPWLALGHGVFNFGLMLLFFYQGWLGFAIRKARMTYAPSPRVVVRRHRKAGPVLAILSTTGFLAGIFIVLIDKAQLFEYPLHFFMGLVIILCLGVTYYISRRIKIQDSAYRNPHTAIGIMMLCVYPIQSLLGLSIIL
jgi:hypothetical protein